MWLPKKDYILNKWDENRQVSEGESGARGVKEVGGDSIVENDPSLLEGVASIPSDNQKDSFLALAVGVENRSVDVLPPAQHIQLSGMPSSVHPECRQGDDQPLPCSTDKSEEIQNVEMLGNEFESSEKKKRLVSLDQQEESNNSVKKSSQLTDKNREDISESIGAETDIEISFNTRELLNPYQKSKLENLFKNDSVPLDEDINDVAKATGLTRRKVKVWGANKKWNIKNSLFRAANISARSDQSSITENSKKRRAWFSWPIVSALVKRYEQNHKLTCEVLQCLMKETGLKKSSITMWFANRRRREGTKTMKRRECLDEVVVNEMKRMFKVNEFVTSDEIDLLSIKYNITRTKVKDWFSYERRKLRIDNEVTSSISSSKVNSGVSDVASENLALNEDGEAFSGNKVKSKSKYSGPLLSAALGAPLSSSPLSAE